VWVCESQTSPRNSPDSSNFKARIRQLFDEARWQEVVDEVANPAITDPDLAFYYGGALAHLGREEDAREAFLAGRRVAPQDPRFPVELAGIAFKQKRYPESARWLRGALQIDPTDAYANNFLGTVYFLQGNLDAALKYWNRLDKPRIESVRAEPPVQIRAALLDHALTFAPASTLLLPDLLTSRKRVAGLGVFPSSKFQLAARDDAKFDVILNLQERNGWGNSKWKFLLSTFRGAPYQTVYLDYFNLGGSALNFTSLWRWDAQKRRVAADFSGPLHQDPKWRYRLGVDLRNENWQIRDSFTGPVLGALNLRREAASAEITAFQSGRWDWSAGLELSHRDYRSVDPGSALNSKLLLEGMQIKQLARVRYDIWRAPERRLVVSSGASSQLARIWSQPAEAFAKLHGSVSAHWFPQSEGDDYETYVQVRGGGTAGTAPFDELYMLGLERDNDLWLRAHIGTRDGRKGSAPLGDRYFLANSEVDKIVYGNGLLTVKMSPFLDVGKIADHTANLGSSKWLWDTGLQAKLRVLGFGLTFTYGKDLRSGHNAFYFSTARR
jgi:tetratricopeptide (TPR) repeat protein